MQRSKQTSLSPTAAYAAVALIGVVLGLITSLSIGNKFQKAIIAHFLWPQEGVVVYADSSYAGATIIDAAGKTFTLSKAGPDGAVVIEDLAPGRYMLNLGLCERKFRKAAQFELLPHKAEIIGYPNRVSSP